MADEKHVPISEEHLEADQFYLDKSRYDMVSKMSPDEQAAFAQMEKAVELLVGTKRPFYLSAAPSKADDIFWRYQKYTQEKVPLSEEEGKLILKRAWFALHAHVSHFASMTGHRIVFCLPDGTPYHMFTDKGEYEMKPPTNE